MLHAAGGEENVVSYGAHKSYYGQGYIRGMKNHHPRIRFILFPSLMLPILVLVMTIIFSRPCSALFVVWKQPQSLMSGSSSSISYSATRSTINRMRLFGTSRRLADTLIQCCVVDKNSTATTTNLRACVVVAGGGGTAISTLASTPGASHLLVEGRVLYDPQSIVHFITNNNNNKHSPISSFCSKETAIALATSALSTCLVVTPSLSEKINCVGIGCTSVLVSNTPHKGQHRCYVALAASNGLCKLYSCIFSKNPMNIPRDTTEEKQPTTQRPRTREEEEELVSSIILYALLKHRREQIVTTYTTHLHSMLPLIDDVLATLNDDTLLVQGEDMFTEEDVTEDLSNDQNNQLLETAVRRVLTNAISTPKGDIYANANSSCLLLVPVRDSSHSTISLTPITPITLPKNIILFPGSFNPPHKGHMMLANAAVKFIWEKQKKQQQQQRDDSTLLLNKEQTPCVIFEMSITNADKPPMDLSEVMKRIQLFCTTPLDLPQDWSIVLTSTPLFVEKIHLFSNVVRNTLTSNHGMYAFFTLVIFFPDCLHLYSFGKRPIFYFIFFIL